jgi:hypothetical protein
VMGRRGLAIPARPGEAATHPDRVAGQRPRRIRNRQALVATILRAENTDETFGAPIAVVARLLDPAGSDSECR